MYDAAVISTAYEICGMPKKTRLARHIGERTPCAGVFDTCSRGRKHSMGRAVSLAALTLCLAKGRSRTPLGCRKRPEISIPIKSRLKPINQIIPIVMSDEGGVD